VASVARIAVEELKKAGAQVNGNEDADKEQPDLL